MITYDRLTPEQDRVLEAPLDHPLVVSGPVGSGRSTAAIYRGLLRVATGHSVLIVVPDLLRKFRLVKLLGDRVGDRFRVLTVSELPGVLLPGSIPVRYGEDDAWVELTMRAVERHVQRVSGGWAVLFDDAHDQPLRALEFARLFDPAVTITVDPDALVSGANLGRPAVQELVRVQAWNHVELSHSQRLLPTAAQLIAALRVRPIIQTSRTSNEPALCLLAAGQTALAAYVGHLARRDRRQRIAIACLRRPQFTELSARLRRVVDEGRYVPVFGGITPAPTARSAGAVVQLCDIRTLRGNEFDVVVIAGLSDRSDRPDNEKLTDALARACGAARSTVVFTTEDLVMPRLLAGLPSVDANTLQVHGIRDVLAAAAPARRPVAKPAVGANLPVTHGRDER